MTTAEIELPPRMRHLPVDPTRPRYRVPWFVAWIDGQPDFRVIRADGIQDALRLNLCWLCGGQLGAYKAFVIGPMCAVNLVSAEPPSHRDCAEYAAKVCPFLTRPTMRRRERGIEDYKGNVAGIMIDRNPGVALIWITKHYRPFSDGNGGILFRLGKPTQTLWFAEGRDATGDEVRASIDSGLPILREMAEQDGEPALRQLDKMVANAMALVPA